MQQEWWWRAMILLVVRLVTMITNKIIIIRVATAPRKEAATVKTLIRWTEDTPTMIVKEKINRRVMETTNAVVLVIEMSEGLENDTMTGLLVILRMIILLLVGVEVEMLDGTIEVHFRLLTTAHLLQVGAVDLFMGEEGAMLALHHLPIEVLLRCLLLVVSLTTEVLHQWIEDEVHHLEISPRKPIVENEEETKAEGGSHQQTKTT